MFTCSIQKQIAFIIGSYGPKIIQYLEVATKVCQRRDIVTDVLTGEFYRECLPNPENSTLWIHLIINSDGARFTKAKTGAFWPAIATVAELPPRLRNKFQNSVLLALWQGCTKPDWKTFLEAAMDELQYLSSVGFEVIISGAVYMVYVKVLATVFDLPARASIWNVVQYNGRNGCMECMQVGQSVDRHFIWPYQESIAEKSTEFWRNQYKRFDNETGAKRDILHGVKGPSVLYKMGIDPSRQNPLDFMHQAYEGIFDRILDSLFGSGHPWSLGKGINMKQVDENLSNIRFPSDFQRRIPPLEQFKSFKAAEMKNLLLYGLIPAVKEHLMARATSMVDAGNFLQWLIIYNEMARRLNSDVIHVDSLPETDELISVWQQILPRFLGIYGQTYNAHATRHLVRYVRLLGPVHNYSAFSFEGFNGLFSKMVTSAHGAIKQVARRYVQEKLVKNWIQEVERSTNSCLQGLVSSVCKSKMSPFHKSFGIVKLLDPAKPAFLSVDEMACLSSLVDNVPLLHITSQSGVHTITQ